MRIDRHLFRKTFPILAAQKLKRPEYSYSRGPMKLEITEEIENGLLSLFKPGQEYRLTSLGETQTITPIIHTHYDLDMKPVYSFKSMIYLLRHWQLSWNIIPKTDFEPVHTTSNDPAGRQILMNGNKINLPFYYSISSDNVNDMFTENISEAKTWGYMGGGIEKVYRTHKNSFGKEVKSFRCYTANFELDPNNIVNEV